MEVNNPERDVLAEKIKDAICEHIPDGMYTTVADTTNFLTALGLAVSAVVYAIHADMPQIADMWVHTFNEEYKSMKEEAQKK